MDQLKEAFQKIKEDISSLKTEVNELRTYLDETRTGLNETRLGLVNICDIIKQLSTQVNENKHQEKQLEEQQKTLQQPVQQIIPYYLPYLIPTNQHILPTNQQIIQADPSSTLGNINPYRPLKEENKDISIGNEGVPTNKQTNQQTDQHKDFSLKSSYNPENSQEIGKVENNLVQESEFIVEKPGFTGKNTCPKLNKERSSMESALNILNSLDSLKKEIRIKFKRLTEQEMLVFSTIYQLEEERGFTDYTAISNKLSLSESSIRDYVGKLIKKGIPVDKNKINNKSVQLSISQNLRKIAPLPTILQLRDL